ncbi:MAG TPA: hypothetical protein VJR92_09485 [Gemmatimonadaceae bacterium]|nr:hypothetical protein [Gemmatimonadaceae bacterium]
MKRFLVGASLLIAVSAGAQQQQGTEMSWRMTSNQTNGTPVEWTVLSAGDRMRMDIDLARFASARGGGPGSGRGGDGGMGRGEEAIGNVISNMTAGLYVLVTGDGKMTVVMPGMQMAVAADVASLAQGNPMGGRGGRGAEVERARDVEAAIGAIEDLGVGERILGHPTRRFRSTSKGARGNTEGTIEMWMANIGTMGAAFQKYSDRFSGMFLGGSSASVNRAFEAKIPKGSVPLKMVIISNSNRGKDTTTIETIDFKQVMFDPAELELPPGMRVLDPNTMMQGMRGRGRGGNY